MEISSPSLHHAAIRPRHRWMISSVTTSGPPICLSTGLIPPFIFTSIGRERKRSSMVFVMPVTKQSPSMKRALSRP